MIKLKKITFSQAIEAREVTNYEKILKLRSLIKGDIDILEENIFFTANEEKKEEFSEK